MSDTERSQESADGAPAERAHHPDCPVNYWRDKPERCRCVFMAMLDRPVLTPPASESRT